MKIVVVASLAYSLVNFRGRLLTDMVANGHEVLACAPEEDAEIAARLAAIGVAYRMMPMARTGLDPFEDLKTVRWLRRCFVEERPDLVLAYTQKPIIYAGLACRLAKGPLFYAMVSGLGHAFGEEARPWLRRLVAALYRPALARASAVFVFNADDRGEMLKHRMIRPEARVVQVPGTGVDLSHYAAAPVPADGPRFLMIARLLKSKGLFDYVEAARRIRRDRPDVRFALLGPLDPNPAGIDAAQVAAWQAEGVIDYLGETRDVRPHLAAASVFVLPSWYREGLPRTILEAMATGRAVITTDMPGCREPIDTGVNGFLVEPRDVDGLTAALWRFVDDPGLAVAMGARALETARTRFSVERVNGILLSTMALGTPQAPAEPRRQDVPIAEAVQ
ncbi:glycosyltransferase family 4 protein [Flavisphingomonas formosensis]|uniref:glycosyltransferase family 4 protein n=1 Tax=Flavisphingomonas formosensis TaxID=861534 RepID=UPI001E5738C8|nr:glycosyltransferase family 4 protein [Sphingomonas formosensis]